MHKFDKCKVNLVDIRPMAKDSYCTARILERYAEYIEDPGKRATFEAAIVLIDFKEVDGERVCTWQQITAVLNNGLYDLLAGLNRKITSLCDMDDLMAIKRVSDR